MEIFALPNELLLNITQFLTRPRDIYSLLPVIHKCAVEDKDGLTALQWAASRGHEGLARFMIKTGVDVNYCGPRTPGEKFVEILLDGGADITQREYGQGNLALHIAASSGNEKVVKLLLDRGADVSVVNKEGETPLYAASSGTNLLIPPLLISYGARVDKVTRFNLTPLHAVASCSWPGSIAIAKVLLENGADINFRNNAGSTPLHRAASTSGCDDMVELLVQQGADVANIHASGQSPLHAAAERHSSRAVKLLLQHGASLTVRDSPGYTPIEAAIFGPEGNMVPYYLPADTNPEDDSEATIRALLCQGASIYSPRILSVHLLPWAIGSGHEDIIRMILEQEVDVNTKGIDGLTSLHWAAALGNEKIVKLLLEKGADMSITANGKTALQLALGAASKGEKVVELLLEHSMRNTVERKRPSAHGSTRGQVLDINPAED